MKRLGLTMTTTAILLASLSPAWAGKADDTLRVTIRDALANIDPYYNGQGSGVMLQKHAWDTLVHRDPESGAMQPLLAVKWTQVDDLTIDFELRPGVTFHNGDPFTADDVVYTIQTVIAPGSKVANPSNFTHIASAEKTGDLSVRLKLKTPFPAALEFLAATTPIWPKAYREKVGADEYAKKPVGTGPYKIVKLDGVGEIVTERFDGYFAGPKPKPAIRTVIFRAVADPTAQMAELIGGKADWIEDVAADQLQSLSRMPNVQTLATPVNSLVYLTLNGAGRDNPQSPLKNVKVRQAIAYAIDRQAMARQFQPGGSKVLNIACYEQQFACDQGKARAFAYDPAKAKALLEEAGYKDGFSIKLYNYLAPSWVAAVQNYLGAVGIKAQIEQMQISALFPMFQRGELPLNLGRWGGGDIGDPSYYLQYFFGGTALDQARDEEVTALVKAAVSNSNADQRKAAYEKAFALVSDRVYQLPLFTYVKTYGMTKSLDFKPSSDSWARFYLASWK
ncbi:ABC transporter substrate-binding protein [uncultured Alsobacter sp.]|uniref:ABC transporter substrate-binding protein n=1 Tax=uncultured Alsobacter sp. TaxID=1748258 RepID=UPI0025EEECD5|nr:ABC transporter substrate-binding protein [uncultured Alsobacter sp.]